MAGIYSYFRVEGREELRHEVCSAFDRLATRYNPIVMEGAGSISEINLRDPLCQPPICLGISLSPIQSPIDAFIKPSPLTT
ncbi:hypothetical protein PZH42_30440, partial [Bacteroides cellulosilyticus]